MYDTGRICEMTSVQAFAELADSIYPSDMGVDCHVAGRSTARDATPRNDRLEFPLAIGPDRPRARQTPASLGGRENSG